MGANQSAGRSNTGSRSIPIRPRTPLRFGSVPTALPVDPSEYNTRPIRNLYPSISTADTVTSLLSQENYLYPPPLSPTSTEEDFEDTPSPASWASPTRYYCPRANCSYSIIGFQSIEEVEYHIHTTAHITPQHQTMVYPQPVHNLPQQPFMIPEQNCMCANCIPYEDEWSAMAAMHVVSAPVSPMDFDFHNQNHQHIHTQHVHYQPSHRQQQHHHHHRHHQCHHSQPQPQHHQSNTMHPMLQIHRPAPMMGGYHGPEVEDISWSGERLPKPMPYGHYPMVKRQRVDFAFVH